MLNVENLTDDEGVQLIFSHLQRGHSSETEYNAAKQLVKLGQGLPVILSSIANYLNFTSSKVESFLPGLESSSGFWTASRFSLSDGEKNALRPIHDFVGANLQPRAQALLRVLAFLDSDDGIPEEIVLLHCDDPIEGLYQNRTESVKVASRLAYLDILMYRAGSTKISEYSSNVSWSVEKTSLSVVASYSCLSFYRESFFLRLASSVIFEDRRSPEQSL